jgi:hypothetical protein
MLKRLRWAFLGLQAALGVLLCTILWLDRNPVNFLPAAGTRDGFSLLKEMEQQHLLYQKHFYKVLYLTKEREKREQVQNFEAETQAYDIAYLNLAGRLDKSDEELETLRKVAQKFSNLLQDNLRLAWAGEQESIAARLILVEKTSQDFLKKIEVARQRLSQAEEQEGVSLLSRAQAFALVRQGLLLGLLSLLLAGTFIFWKRVRSYFARSFYGWEAHSKKLTEAATEAHQNSTEALELLKKSQSVLGLMQKQWKEGFQLLPKAKELSTKLEHNARGAEAELPHLLEHHHEHLKNLENLLVSLRQTSTSEGQASAATLEMSIKRYEAFSGTLINLVKELQEQRPTLSLVKGAAELLHRAWSDIERYLASMEKQLSQQAQSEEALRGRLLEALLQTEKFELLRRDWEQWSLEALKRDSSRSVFVEEESGYEPGEGLESKAPGVKDYFLAETALGPKADDEDEAA